MAGTFQNLSGGRLLLNVVTGGESREQRMFGDFLDKEAALRALRRVPHHRPRAVARRDGDLRGRAPARRGRRADPDPRPAARRSTSAARRAAAGRVAAKHADVYLTWGEPPDGGAPRRSSGSASSPPTRAARAQVRFGIRLHTIARDTSEEAWAEADRLLAGISEEQIAKVQAGLKQSESVGQARMLDLNGGTKDGLEIHPNLWAGVGLVRGGAGTAMVGSHAEIADLVEQYAAVGIEEFVLSGYPHLEEAYWFGEGVLPELARRGRWEHPAPVDRPRVGAVRLVEGGLVTDLDRRRRRQPEAGLAHARRRDVRRPRAAGRRARPGRRPGHPRRPAARLAGPRGRRRWSPRSVPPTWSSSPRPTYKATYTGLLKLFLDRFATDGLRGVAVPLMLGAGPAHALAPELTLRPVLTEIGGTTVRGLYVVTAGTTTRPRTPTGWPWSGPSSRRCWPRACRHDRHPAHHQPGPRPGRLREAFGVFPSGVVAVAAEVDGELVGLAASSFTSVSLDPPLVSFSVANTSKTWPALRRAAHLGLTVLADHHGEVCRQLAGPVEHRFDDVPSPPPTTARSPSTRGWPASTARSTARSRPATTRSCCSSCTPSRP